MYSLRVERNAFISSTVCTKPFISYYDTFIYLFQICYFDKEAINTDIFYMIMLGMMETIRRRITVNVVFNEISTDSGRK
jgi:hypothetical protein